MTLKVTILGCGSSGGVPRVGNIWGKCDPENPKNNRRRCSIFVEQASPDGVTGVLVDTSPDLRMQLIDAGIDYIDAVLYTHEHADHIHGIDDLRQIFFNRGSRIDAYISDDTYKVMGPRFDYCFATPKGSSYPPIMKRLSVHPYELVRVCGKGGEMIVMPIKQLHGHITSIGYRFGNFAYTTDLHGFPDEAVEHLANLDVWVIDALRYSSHPSHLSVSDALQWIEKMQPKQAFFTNMHHDLDYETLKRELPAHVAPAYDGLSFTL